ncbi:hypothetical protein [Allocoleopsis sp.]|uniref:hypothetical protein n=1 Tax=Allocoleopsis sp. TaxID=3088169 RepID=UPI002FCEB751
MPRVKRDGRWGLGSDATGCESDQLRWCNHAIAPLYNKLSRLGERSRSTTIR